MKRYKFKLEALLKIRKIKEDKCKQEIGRMQIELSEIKNEIIVHDLDVATAFNDQEESLAEGIEGLSARFYPYFVEAKHNNIKILKQEQKVMEARIQDKFRELASLRADVKVIDKMKEKDFAKFKKEKNKKESADLEELSQMWNLTK